jgi:hypothetical protein
MNFFFIFKFYLPSNKHIFYSEWSGKKISERQWLKNIWEGLKPIFFYSKYAYAGTCPRNVRVHAQNTTDRTTVPGRRFSRGRRKTEIALFFFLFLSFFLSYSYNLLPRRCRNIITVVSVPPVEAVSTRPSGRVLFPLTHLFSVFITTTAERWSSRLLNFTNEMCWYLDGGIFHFIIFLLLLLCR